MAERTEKTTPRDVLRIVFRRRWMFLVPAAVFAFAALVSARWWPVKFTGMAIFERRTDAAAEETTRGQSAESFGTFKLTLQHELAGRMAVEDAAETLGLTRGLSRAADGQYTLKGQMGKQELVGRIMDAVQVKWEVRSDQVDLVSVSFTDRDPALAQEMPNTMVKRYITRVSDEIVRRLDDSKKFLQNRVDEGKTRLAELTKQRIDFETKNSGLLPDSPSALQDRLQLINTDMDTVRRQQTVAQQKLQRFKVLSQNTPTPEQPVQVVKGPNPDLMRLKEELKRVQAELDDAVTIRHMTEKHPTILTLRKKIDDLEKKIKDTPEEAVLHRIYGPDTPPPSQDLAVELAGAQAEVDMTAREMERLQERQTAVQNVLANFGPVRMAYLLISKEIQDQTAEADRWQKRLSDVQMNLEAEVAKRRTHLNAVQWAQKQFRPSSPALWQVLAAALAGGIAFGGGLVFLANTLDRAVLTTEDAAQHFDLPVVGIIGEIVTPRERVLAKVKRVILVPLVSLAIVAGLGLATLNIVLWLQYPDQYEQWKADPPEFLIKQIEEGAQTLRRGL